MGGVAIIVASAMTGWMTQPDWGADAMPARRPGRVLAGWLSRTLDTVYVAVKLWEFYGWTWIAKKGKRYRRKS